MNEYNSVPAGKQDAIDRLSELAKKYDTVDKYNKEIEDINKWIDSETDSLDSEEERVKEAYRKAVKREAGDINFVAKAKASNKAISKAERIKRGMKFFLVMLAVMVVWFILTAVLTPASLSPEGNPVNVQLNITLRAVTLIVFAVMLLCDVFTGDIPGWFAVAGGILFIFDGILTVIIYNAHLSNKLVFIGLDVLFVVILVILSNKFSAAIHKQDNAVAAAMQKEEEAKAKIEKDFEKAYEARKYENAPEVIAVRNEFEKKRQRISEKEAKIEKINGELSKVYASIRECNFLSDKDKSKAAVKALFGYLKSGKAENLKQALNLWDIEVEENEEFEFQKQLRLLERDIRNSEEAKLRQSMYERMEIEQDIENKRREMEDTIKRLEDEIE